MACVRGISDTNQITMLEIAGSLPPIVNGAWTDAANA